MFQTKVVEKIKTQIRDNVEKYGTIRQATHDNITRRMRFACWLIKATDTQPEYVILIAFPRQQWLLERVSMLHYTYMPPFFPIISSIFLLHIMYIKHASKVTYIITRIPVPSLFCVLHFILPTCK
jgi:hypothetical protein